MLCNVLKHLSNIIVITIIIEDMGNDLGWKMELLLLPVVSILIIPIFP